MSTQFVAAGNGASVEKLLETLVRAMESCLAAPAVDGKNEWLERAEKAREHLLRLALVAGSGARTDVALVPGGVTRLDANRMAWSSVAMATETTNLPQKRYQAQEWDSDCECWRDMEHEGAGGRDRYEVAREAEYQAQKCAYNVKTRVVEA